MNIFDLISEDEINNAPEDPAFAFTELVSIAEKRLAKHLENFDPQDRDDQVAVEEARYAFMNAATALARIYKIEPFSNVDVPRWDDFGIGMYRQFKADLDHYMVQLVVDNSIRGKRDTTLVPLETKERIRTYIGALRDAIDKANITEAKRVSLHNKLTEFEAELEKRRLSLKAVAVFAVAVAAVPGNLWASYTVVNKLTGNVLQLVGEAKEIEDEKRKLPPVRQPLALTAPRREEQKAREGRFSQDLDDEIPF